MSASTESANVPDGWGSMHPGSPHFTRTSDGAGLWRWADPDGDGDRDGWYCTSRTRHTQVHDDIADAIAELDDCGEWKDGEPLLKSIEYEVSHEGVKGTAKWDKEAGEWFFSWSDRFPFFRLTWPDGIRWRRMPDATAKWLKESDGWALLVAGDPVALVLPSGVEWWGLSFRGDWSEYPGYNGTWEGCMARLRQRSAEKGVHVPLLAEMRTSEPDTEWQATPPPRTACRWRNQVEEGIAAPSSIGDNGWLFEDPHGHKFWYPGLPVGWQWMPLAPDEEPAPVIGYVYDDDIRQLARRLASNSDNEGAAEMLRQLDVFDAARAESKAIEALIDRSCEVEGEDQALLDEAQALLDASRYPDHSELVRAGTMLAFLAPLPEDPLTIAQSAHVEAIRAHQAAHESEEATNARLALANEEWKAARQASDDAAAHSCKTGEALKAAVGAVVFAVLGVS